MKICILSIRIIWKNKWSYLLLLFELVLVAVIFLSICSKLQGTISSWEVVNTFSGENMYYYSQNSYTDKSLQDILRKDTLEKLQIIDIPYIFFRDRKNRGFSALGYCDSIISVSQFKLSEGVWFHKYKGKNIPVISADSDYQTGDMIELKRNGKICKLEVIGCMDRNAYILNFHGSSSFEMGHLDSLVSHPDVQLIVPYYSNKYLSVSEQYLDYCESSISKIVLIPDEDTAKQFIDQCREYGSISSIETMEKNYNNKLRDDFIVNGVVFIVFVILSIVGLVGFNGIQSAIYEKSYIIYYLLGCTHSQCVKIEVLKNILMLGISYIIVWVIREKSDIFAYSVRDLAVIDRKTIALTFLFLFLICFTTTIGYIKKLARKNLVAAYKQKV